MKWFKAAISRQNIYLKLVIFLIGIVTGLDSSLRQLLALIALFLLFLLFEPRLYLNLLSAFRRVLPFFAGYWLFATIFQQGFPASVCFSVQIIYLVLITVAVFGGAKMSSLASDSHSIRRCVWINAIFFYIFATWMFVKSFINNYRVRQETFGSEPLSIQIKEVLSAVHNDTESIREKLQSVLASTRENTSLLNVPNVTGIAFLALLVLVSGL